MASRSAKQMRYAKPVPLPQSAPKPRPRMAANIKPLVRTIKKPVVDAVDASGNRLGERRRAGEADAATRRAAIDAALRPGPPVKPAAPKPKPAPDASGAGGRARGRKIDELTDQMARGRRR